MKNGSLFKRNSSANSVVNDLDVTPFLSLMVVLIPVLLIMVNFTVLSDYNMQVYSQSQSLSHQKQQAKLATHHFYRLVIYKNEAVLKEENKDKSLFRSALDGSLANKLNNVFGEVDKQSISLIVDVEAIHTYQKMVLLFDVLNTYKDKISSMSIFVKDGL